MDIDFRGVWWARSRWYHYPPWTVENSISFILLTKGKKFMNLNFGLFVIHQICCNTHCQHISIVGIILWIWYLIIFMDLYILDENFIEFLSYINIDSPGIIPMWEWYVPCGHSFYYKLYNWGSKIFLVLMTRRGNIFVFFESTQEHWGIM